MPLLILFILLVVSCGSDDNVREIKEITPKQTVIYETVKECNYQLKCYRDRCNRNRCRQVEVCVDKLVPVSI